MSWAEPGPVSKGHSTIHVSEAGAPHVVGPSSAHSLGQPVSLTVASKDATSWAGSDVPGYAASDGMHSEGTGSEVAGGGGHERTLVHATMASTHTLVPAYSAAYPMPVPASIHSRRGWTRLNLLPATGQGGEGAKETEEEEEDHEEEVHEVRTARSVLSTAPGPMGTVAVSRTQHSSYATEAHFVDGEEAVDGPGMLPPQAVVSAY